MVELALALQKKQPGQKVSALRKCIQSGLSSPALQTEAIFAQEKIKLLERQILIEVCGSFKGVVSQEVTNYCNLSVNGEGSSKRLLHSISKEIIPYRPEPFNYR